METQFLPRSFSAQPPGAGSPWLSTAVFGLDRWLRRRHGVYEYTTAGYCIFRIGRIEPPRAEIASSGPVHHVGEGILMFLLVMAANPAAIRLPALSRAHKVVYLSRAALERHFAADIGAQ